MRVKLKRICLAGCASLLLLAGIPSSAYAEKAEPSTYDPWGTSALGPGYPSVVANYSPTVPGSGIEQGEQAFSFSVSVDGTTIPLHLSFPALGGFRLYSDQTGYFEAEEYRDIQYTQREAGQIAMTAGDDATVVYSQTEDAFALDVYNEADVRLFRITSEQIGFAYSRGELAKVRLEMPLAEDEAIYGTGERFNELNQVGRRLLMWNVDAGYHGNSAYAELWRGYKNIPILHSNRGYTLFFNSFYSASADIGYTNEQKYTLEFQGPQFDVYFWTGTPEENLVSYTDLTGKSVLLPKWAYQYSAGAGSGVWTSTGSMYGMAVEAMEKYAELGTPNIAAVYVEGIDSDDANVYNVFKKTGTRVMKWNAPDMSLAQMQESLPGVSDSELPRVKMLRSPTQDSGNFFDFTDDSSITLLKNFLQREIGWGLVGGLLDFGELIQPNTLFRGNNLTGYEMHNFFPYWYAKSYYTAMAETLGNNEFVFISRSASAGTQQYTAFFTGDQQANMEGLRQQLSAGLSASSSGITMWGGDLAGYAGTPTNTVFARGVQFAAFQPLMRSHGTASRFPWDYGEVGIHTYQTHYWLRENLLNKIYSAAVVSHKTGLPITKPLTMAYPDDPSLDGVYETYLFCDDLLVTPVLQEDVYLYDVTFPAGTWYSLWDGSKIAGGSTQTVEAPIDKSPVYLKAGSVFPVTVAPSLQLTESMQDQESVEMLLAAVPDSDRSSVYYKDEETSVQYQSSIVDSSTFRITAGEGNDAQGILLKGVAAYSVTVDGKALVRLAERPSAGGETGFYSSSNGETVIYIGSADWKTAEISLGHLPVVNVLQNASVNIDDLKNAIDGDWNTVFSFSSNTEAEAPVFELKDATPLESIVLKWTYLNADKYVLSVSTDGEQWEEVAAEENSFGGICSYHLNGKQVKYIRISDVSGESSRTPMLYEVEAYEKLEIADTGTAPGQGGRLPAWGIALICVGAAVAAGAAAFAIVWFVKRKRPAAADVSR